MSLYFLIQCGISLRSTQKIFKGLNIYFNLDFSIPSHTTLSNWRKKTGYYCLQQKVEIADDWVIIVDESIQLGASKLLLILGIRDSIWDFERPLKLTDMQILYMASHSPCDAPVVGAALEKVKQKVGKIKYAIADQGANLQKALRVQEIPVVLDITHIMANHLKKQYKQDEQYLELSKKLRSTTHQIKQTSLACLMAPKKRSKSRFMNLYSFSDWGNKIMQLLLKTKGKFESDLSQQEKDILCKMGWIADYQDFFEELNKILEYVKQVFIQVKTKGVGQQTTDELEEIQYEKAYEKMEYIESETKKYLKSVNDLLASTNNTESTKINMLCCSDVIESTFGRFKNQMGQYYQNGVTSLALTIPAFTSELTPEVLLKVMNNTSHKDLAQWEEQNIDVTLLKTRQKLIPKNSIRKKTTKHG